MGRKGKHVVAFSLVSTISAMKLKVKTTATTLAKIAFPQINCLCERHLWRVHEERTRDVAKKRHFITKI